jgi:AsmA protein
MGKLVKIILIFFSSIIGLIVAAVIITPLIVDLNDYKPEIEAAINDKIGRKINIVGDIDISIFPWLGVSTGKIALSNAQGFTPDSFAVIKQSHIKIKLIPLFSKAVEVSTIVVKGLELNLAKNKQGLSNWEDLTTQTTAEKSVPKKQVTTKDPTSSVPALAALMIGGLSIEDAKITWDDQQKGQKVIIKDFNFKTGKISLNKPIDIELSLFLENKNPAITKALSLSTQLQIAENFQLIHLNNTNIKSSIKGAILPNGAMDVQLLSHIILDLKQESLTLEKLKIVFDATTMNGFLRIKPFKKPALEFNLAINEIDVDRYSAKKANQQTKIVASPAVVAVATSALIPVQTIRDLNIQGDISIDKLKISGLTVRGVKLKLQAKNGILRTKQTINQLYGGQYKGQITLNTKSKTPKIALNEKISKVQIGQLLKALNPDLPVKLTGTLNLAAKLKTQGNSISRFKSNLAGNLNFSVNTGAIQGINIQKIIDMGKLFTGKTMKKKYANEQTLFSTIKGTGTIRRGIITNPNFLMNSAQLIVNGSGTVNLVNEKIKYNLKAKLTHKVVQDRPVVIKVAGTISKPTYTVDILAMINKTEKQKIKKVLNKALGKVRSKAIKLLNSFF